MTTGTDDRDHRRIRRFWSRVENLLREYAERWSAVRLVGLLNREGVYISLASVVLVGLLGLAWSRSLRSSWAAGPVLGLLPSYYVADSVLVSTSIAFISRDPAVHGLRSIALTLANMANVALAFSVLYAIRPCVFRDELGLMDLLYFSVATLATIGYGDITPNGNCAWLGQLMVVAEVAVSLYFFTAVVATVVSWASESGAVDKRDPRGEEGDVPIHQAGRSRHRRRMRAQKGLWRRRW